MTPDNQYLLGTNALVALLQGHPGSLAFADHADWLGVSVINVLDFLDFDSLLEEDRLLFNAFVSRIFVVDLALADTTLMNQIGRFRRGRAIELPDAIIAASSVIHQAGLVTNDNQLHKLAADYPGLAIEQF